MIMVPKLSFCIFTIVLVGAAAWAESPGPRGDNDDPIVQRIAVIAKYMEVLRGIPDTAEFLTEEQDSAIQILGTYRSVEAADELVRLVEVKGFPGHKAYYHRSGGVYGYDGPKEVRFPALDAIALIGTPAINAIVGDLERRQAANPPSAKRIQLYARVVSQMFPGNLGLVYITAQRDSAINELQSRFDPLIKQLEASKKPSIKMERPKPIFGNPAETKP